MDRAKELAEAHWSYIEALLKQHGEIDIIIERVGFHYREAFKHGYKHCQEDMDGNVYNRIRKNSNGER